MKTEASRNRLLAILFSIASFIGIGSALGALPASVDSDVYGYLVSPNFRTNFVFAGRLQLKPTANNPTFYSGSFFDYDAQSPYQCGVDASNAAAPMMIIATRNGTFHIQLDSFFGTSFYSGTSTQVPPALATAGPAYFSASNHATTTVVYNVVVSQRTGLFTYPFEIAGQLIIYYDANNRIGGGVTFYMDAQGNAFYDRVYTGYYSTSYLYLKAKFGGTTFGIGATFSGTFFSGNAFTGTGPTARTWVISGSPS